MLDHTDALAGPDARQAFATWLTERLPGHPSVRVVDSATPSSGYSAHTTFVTAALHDGQREHLERYVVRLESADEPVYPVQNPAIDVEIAVQYRAMSTLRDAAPAVPLAPLYGFEAGAEVLGAPFYVMGFVDGQVPVEDPIYTREGFFAEASPHERRRLVEHGLDVLSAVNAVDPGTADLGWLTPPGVVPGTVRQLELWTRYAERELRGREHPLLARALAWLADERPDDPPLSLSWGDPRPGNMIWRDFRCVCATDFEAVSIAPPEYDLGWWLMFDRWSHETLGVPRLPGEPSRPEQRERYAAALGRDVGDTSYWEVFAAARYTAIVVRVMNRLVDRGVLPPDQDIWLHNPAADCLADLLPA